MAVHLSIRRIRFVPLAVSLVALVGLAVVAGAVYLPTRTGPEIAPGLRVETTPEAGYHAALAGLSKPRAEPLAQPLGEPLPEPLAQPLAEPLRVVAPAEVAPAEAAPASAVAESVSGTGKAPATGETKTALIREAAVSVRPEKAPESARIATAGPVLADPVDASPADASPADAGPAIAGAHI